MAKFAINASGATLLPSLVQVSESISGSVVPLAMFVWGTCSRSPLCQRVRNGDILQCNHCDEAFSPVKNLKKHKRVLRRIACSCQRIRNGLLCLHIELSSHPKTTTKVADMEVLPRVCIQATVLDMGEMSKWRM